MMRVGRLGLFALLLIAAMGAGAGWLESQLSRPYWRNGSDQVFVDIPRGTSRMGIAEILARNHIIRNQLAFTLFSEWHHRRQLQAGEYLFDHPVDSREVFWKIAHGQIYVRWITVPEGWTMYDIANEMQSQGVCSRQQFLAAARDTSLISDIAPQARNLEGFLFPSTYQFTRHTSCDQVVKRMTQDFRATWERLDPSGPQQDPGSLTPAQVVSLASLVERETPNPDERPLVAGVFSNHACTWAFHSSAIQPFNMRWNCQATRGETSAQKICASIRRITPTSIAACLPDPSEIPAKLLCEQRWPRHKPNFYILSPIIRAAIFSPAPSRNIIAMSRGSAIFLQATRPRRLIRNRRIQNIEARRDRQSPRQETHCRSALKKSADPRTRARTSQTQAYRRRNRADSQAIDRPARPTRKNGIGLHSQRVERGRDACGVFHAHGH